MFWSRTISGIVLVLIALISFTQGGWLLAGVVLFISLVGFLELTHALGVRTEEKKVNGLEIAGLSMIVLYYLGAFFIREDIITIMALTVAFLLFLFIYVVAFPKFNAEQVIKVFFSLVYAPMMLSFIFLTRELHYGEYIVWLILISSWGCDTCAYVVGMSFGKTIGNHKSFPHLSPKKSWEGCIGGVVGAAAIGALYGHFVLENIVKEQEITWIVALICAIGAVFSQMGDLAASAIKRNHDIKDYGHLIPGHGGIMDRFDSVIVTAPLTYFLVRLLIVSVLVSG